MKTLKPTMTRQHFKAIADGIKALPFNVRKEAAPAMADAFVQFNNRFNRDRFLKACGV